MNNMQIQCQVIFNPNCDISELKELFVTLHRLYPEIPDDPRKFKSLSDTTEKDREISNNNETIKRLLKEIEKKDKVLIDKDTKIDGLENQISEYSKLYESVSDEKQTLEKEKTDIENKTKAQIDALKNQYDEQILALNKQIFDLKGKVEVYEPHLGGLSDDNLFFRTDSNGLVQTNADDAPFIANVSGDGKAIFQFNVDKGPHKDLISNFDKYKDYCDVIDQVDEANHVAMGKWGEGSCKDGCLTVKSRAKIKLIKV